MKRWLVAVACVLFVTTAQAQDEPRDMSGEKGARVAPRNARGGKPMTRGDSFDMQVRRLRTVLGLSEEQNAELDKIIESMPDRKERRGPVAEDGEGGGAEDRLALLRELSEARQSGDEAKMKEVKAKLAAAGRGASSRQRGEKFERLLHEIEPILSSEQKEKLDRFRDELRHSRRRGVASPEEMFRVLEKLNLDEGQQEKVARLAEKLADDMAGFEKMDAGDRQKFSRRVEDGIKDILNRQQREKFDDLIAQSTNDDNRSELRNRQREPNFGGDGDRPREKKRRRPSHEAPEGGDHP